MKKEKKQDQIWEEKWMKVKVVITCPNHNDIKKLVLLDDYAEALYNKSRKKKWFCEKCGKRLVRTFEDINFILPKEFNTKLKKEK